VLAYVVAVPPGPELRAALPQLTDHDMQAGVVVEAGGVGAVGGGRHQLPHDLLGSGLVRQRSWPADVAVGEPVQVTALVLGQPQHTRQAVEYLGRGVDVAALLQVAVPGWAEPGEYGDLLAAANSPAWGGSPAIWA
jgi:hypothetical protein